VTINPSPTSSLPIVVNSSLREHLQANQQRKYQNENLRDQGGIAAGAQVQTEKTGRMDPREAIKGHQSEAKPQRTNQDPIHDHQHRRLVNASDLYQHRKRMYLTGAEV